MGIRDKSGRPLYLEEWDSLPHDSSLAQTRVAFLAIFTLMLISCLILFEKFPNQLPHSFPPSLPTNPNSMPGTHTHMHSLSLAHALLGSASVGGWSEDPELFFQEGAQVHIEHNIRTMFIGESESTISLGTVTHLVIVSICEVRIKAK